MPLLHSIPPLGQNAKPTLQDFLFPETMVYTLDVALEKLITRPCETLEGDTGQTSYGVLLRDEICSAWTSFLPSEIEVIPKQPGNALSATPRKVKFVGDTIPFFFKLAQAGDQSIMEREIQTYKKTKDAGLEDDLRISRLHGLVQDEDGLILGLLLTYIDCGNRSLACAGPEAPPALRRRWADQVRATVERLHRAGVIWGDVKAENVLVDSDEDAWVIDFGGGYTEGCVEKESAGTVEGDLQGMENLFQFLGV